MLPTLKDQINLQKIILMMLGLLMMTSKAQGSIQVSKIQEETGFARIKVGQIEIANNTDTILHMINPGEMTEILKQIELNSKQFSTK